MEEKIIRHLNWAYYGTMILALIALSVMYYMTSHGLLDEPIDPLSDLGTTLQYVIYLMTLVCIPFGLYLIKWRKPDTLEQYEELAMIRILCIGGLMTPAIMIYYLLGCYRPVMWVTAILAVAWYFTKPTLAKMEQEMTPEDPNNPTY